MRILRRSTTIAPSALSISSYMSDTSNKDETALKELRFVANSIATDDAYYLHFSDRQRDPTNYIVIQGRRGAHPSISVRAEHETANGVGGIQVNIEPNFITFHLSPDLASKLGGWARVIAEFKVDQAKYESICRQLWEILGYRREEGTETQQGHERGRL